MEVWNGLTPKRQDLGTVKATSHDDYLVLVQKIQELQAYTLHLTNNVQVMPDLEMVLQASQDKIQEVFNKIASLTLPQDVKDRLDQIEQVTSDVDQRVEVKQLRRDFEILREQVARNQIEVLQLQSSFATEVKGFQNKVWGVLEKLQKETSTKISALEDQVKHVDAQLEVQSSLEKYNRLRSQ